MKKHLGQMRIPAFDLAVWLFREERWRDEVRPETIREELISKFHITPEERRALFDLNIPTLADPWCQPEQIPSATLVSMLESAWVKWPEISWRLTSLHVNNLGPAVDFEYEPSARLNIIAGDNSLGKTFILDCLWWTLAGEFCGHPILPDPQVAKKKAFLSVEFESGGSRRGTMKFEFDWSKQRWVHHRRKSQSPGLVIFSRFDGSFAIWDPIREHISTEERARTSVGHLSLSRDQVLRGRTETDGRGQDKWVCNGLIRDWVAWQTSSLERHRERFKALVACLKELAPSQEEPLTPGEPRPFLNVMEQQDMPVLKMPYGRDVPLVHASAAIQRIVSLAYMLVWVWHEHLALSAIVRQPPQRTMVLMIDEVEAHLHPRWQRVIVPAILKTVETLSPGISIQLHLATHSPMVLASAETVFDEARDNLHHLRLSDGRVVLEELDFVKRGTADLWLMNEVFGLRQARNKEAEDAIERAKALQSLDDPPRDELVLVDRTLKRVLADDDQFWTRWRQFALQHGINT